MRNCYEMTSPVTRQPPTVCCKHALAYSCSDIRLAKSLQFFWGGTIGVRPRGIGGNSPSHRKNFFKYCIIQEKSTDGLVKKITLLGKINQKV